MPMRWLKNHDNWLMVLMTAITVAWVLVSVAVYRDVLKNRDATYENKAEILENRRLLLDVLRRLTPAPQPDAH